MQNLRTEQLKSAGKPSNTFSLFDGFNREIERISFDEQGAISYRQIRFYVHIVNNTLVRTLTLDANGILQETNEIHKDTKGRVVDDITFSHEGDVIDRQNYIYDDNSNELTFTRFGYKGEVIEKWKAQTD